MATARRANTTRLEGKEPGPGPRHEFSAKKERRETRTGFFLFFSEMSSIQMFSPSLGESSGPSGTACCSGASFSPGNALKGDESVFPGRDVGFDGPAKDGRINGELFLCDIRVFVCRSSDQFGISQSVSWNHQSPTVVSVLQNTVSIAFVTVCRLEAQFSDRS